MALEPLDYLNGIFNLIFIFISIILGLIIMFKYFKNKNINFILIGIFLILLTCGWWGTSTSFLIASISGSEGLSIEMILFLNFAPLPIGLLIWLTAYSNFLCKEKQKIILISYSGILFLFYIYFFYLLLTNPSEIAEKISPVDTSAKISLLLIFLMLFIITVLITGIKFALETIKFDDPETKLKGKLLLLAFPSFIFGGILDSMFPSTAITLVVFRLILISSSIEFYGGFILPEWIKKILLKNKKI
ncbi:MAG: hypothetical protein ACTSUT_02220 [Promethearchaeota archaeon]